MVLVYADEKTARLEYTVRLIFQDILGSEVELTTDSSRFLQARVPKINYSSTPLSDDLFLAPAELLFTTSREVPTITPVVCGEETGFFETPEGSFLPFDPFASAFLVVSRLEEYHDGPRDLHDRFPGSRSLLYRYGLLGKAVVNRWARLIAVKLEEKVQCTIFPPKKFSYLPTIDVDNAWAYLHKGFFRTAGSLLRKFLNGNMTELKQHLRVLAGKADDPYDNFDTLATLFRGNEEKVHFFFLLGDYARYDKQVSPENRAFRKLIADNHLKFRTGLHPSYASSKDPSGKVIRKEKERLEKIIDAPVNASRNHFLMLRFPDTYRKLEGLGIGEDYSMGYADHPGFRAGICTPYFFYDLTREAATRLRIIPFQVMDVTLRQYLKLSPDKSILKIKEIMDEVKASGGTFCSIWHNESISDTGLWKGYRRVFETMNELGFRYANEQ